MKNLFFVMTFPIFIIACNNSSDEPATNEDTAAAVDRFYWEATDTSRIVVTKIEGDGPDTIAPEPILRFLNNQSPKVQMVFKKISNDTIFIQIPEATYFTQQMGSSGPRTFLASAVYNLTEIPGIRYVDFDFHGGDHAWPETLDRNSVKEY